MPGPKKPRTNARKPRVLRVAFALFTVAIIIVSSIAVFEYLNNVRPYQQSAQSPSEPLPALWQKNLSGIPSTIETSGTGTFYVLVDSHGNWTGNPPWNLYAIQLSNGSVKWHHNLTLRNQANAQPELYLHNSELYLVGAGSSLSLNGTGNVISNGSYAMYIVPFNQSDGNAGKVQSIAMPLNFSQSGTFSVYGSHLYASWVTETGQQVEAAAFSAFGGSSGPVLSWETALTPPATYNTNIPGIRVNGNFLVIPAWNLIALNSTNGHEIFSVNYTTLNSDRVNLMNGALVNSTFYYVAELYGHQGTVNLNLVGLDLFTGKATVNVTVSNSSQGLYPLQVRHYGKELAVSTGLSGEYVVTNLEGKTLWNSRNISYLATSGETHVSPGSPVAVLSNGNWLLSLVSYPPHNSGLANQYLEEVYPSNGTLVWIHQFSFEESADSYQFMPPSTTAPPYVIVMPSQPPYIVYRWGSSLGCAAL